MAWNERNVVKGINLLPKGVVFPSEPAPIRENNIPERTEISIRATNNNPFKMDIAVLRVYLSGLGHVKFYRPPNPYAGIDYRGSQKNIDYRNVSLVDNGAVYMASFENLKHGASDELAFVVVCTRFVDPSKMGISVDSYEGILEDGTSFKWEWNKEKEGPASVVRYGKEAGYLTGAMRRPDPIVPPSEASVGWFGRIRAFFGANPSRPAGVNKAPPVENKPQAK